MIGRLNSSIKKDGLPPSSKTKSTVEPCAGKKEIKLKLILIQPHSNKKLKVLKCINL